VRSILVVYGLLQHPLRSTVEDHLYALRRHSQARCFYVNAALGPVPGWIRMIEHDAIVFHTSFLSTMRWAPGLAPALRERARALADAPALRAVMPQDEFLRSADLCGFIREARVDVVFSVSPPSEWPKIYADVDRERVHFEEVLTGYLDDRTLSRIEELVEQTPQRPHDLFYRAGAERPYLGRHGMLKTEIARAGLEEARARGLSADISVSPKDTLLGDDWFRALAGARWTLGVEGGSSILDRDGEIRTATERYLADHPDAGYDNVEAACFPGRDGELALFALSPRHLEACATRTGQILVEGGYSGVLEAGRHYLALRPDLSNLGAVLEDARDEGRRRELTETAYRELVASGRYTYRGFVEHVEATLFSRPAPARGPLRRAALRTAALGARAYDQLSWVRVRLRLRGLRLGRPRLHRRSPARETRAPTVVSVTPARLDADSRTLKEAASLSRAGLRSIVLEGLPSSERWDGQPFEVVGLMQGSTSGGGDAETAAPKPSALRRLVRPLGALVDPLIALVAFNRATAASLPPADLYWVHGSRQLLAVALNARRLGVPFVYDAHDFYADAVRNNPSLTRVQRRALWLDRMVERACVPLAAARLTVSEGVRDLQEARFRRPFAVLRNAHDPRLDRPSDGDLRDRLKLGDDAFLLVAVGNSKTGTAFEPAFAALAALPEHVHLAFVGRDYEDAADLARERGLAGRVHFVPPVPPAEVTSFIRCADAAAILYFPLTPNFVSALPNRLFQAIAAGLPLLYPSALAAIRALCEEQDVGVAIDPQDADSLAAAVRRLLDDPEKLARLRKNAERAAERLTWEREERRLLALVNGLVKP
jgi:glycosyltransferase involved in cell wall biosynthesis